jgi:CubicO group peptidase (beta-lactamase class C family)
MVKRMDRVKPEKAGFSAARLACIGTAMQRHVDEKRIAGAVTLVVRHGKLVHFEKGGMAVMEDGRAMELDTIFRIYSMTKPITSVALMMLLEEGRLRLSDPVSRYLPAFGNPKVMEGDTASGFRLLDASRPIDIHDLLTHTSGLSHGFQEDAVGEVYRKDLVPLESNRDQTLETWVNAVARMPLAHQPGTRFRYSFATDVLGLLVQVVSGMPFDEFLARRVFEPLGMTDTAFFVPPEKIDRFAAVYTLTEDGRLMATDAPRTSEFARPTKCPRGGSGLVSTAGDYLRFAQMLLDNAAGEGGRSAPLLGRKTIELMTANHLPAGIHPFDDPALGFGLGGSVVIDLGALRRPGSVGEFSWSGAANTRFWIDPREQIVGVLMVQFMPFDRLFAPAVDFATLVYQALD